MKKALFALPLVALMTACATTTPDLPTEQGVDLSRYAGTWYEQARLPAWFQKECSGDVRANYVLLPDQTLQVTNQCRTSDGSMKVAEGEGRLAKVNGVENPAQLEIRFAPKWTSWIPMVWGDYWIIDLDSDYQYSLVGTPDRKYLWVLTREKEADRGKVDRLLERARELGFPVDEVIRTDQG